MKFNVRLIVFLFMATIFFSCDDNSMMSENDTSMPLYPQNMKDDILGSNRIDFELNNIPLTERFYRVTNPYPVQTDVPFDEDSVPLYEIKGELYYHPVYLGRLALWYLSTHVYNGDERSLRHAEAITKKVVDKAISINGSLYYPYNFNSLLHNNEDLVRIAPWFSGMAQGRMLTVLSRLYSITEDPYYIEKAEQTFSSFYNSPNQSEPWVALIDNDNYFWIEEYPDWPDPNFTLNGFGATIIGLYDYFSISSDPMAKVLLNSALTTFRDKVELYRMPGDLSLYCLAHKVQRELYHNIHIKQLNALYEMTSDTSFSYWSGVFENDY